MAKVCHEIGMCFYVNLQCAESRTDFSNIKHLQFFEINKNRGK